MLSYTPPIADYQFLLHQYLGVQSLVDQLPEYSEYGEDFTRAVLEEAGKVCVNELLPINQVGDSQGCELVDGRVKTPDGFPFAYQKLMEGGWIGLSGDPAYGGQGLPSLLSMPVAEMLVSSNLALSGYVDITQAAARTLSTHGSADLKKKYLAKLVSGEWGGAMALTEPQAGTDLGLVNTRAVRREDGRYEISGGKIFITGSDQDLTENIVVLTLARVEGAPNGTKGLSLFVVPRVHVDDSGFLLERNSVETVSVEHKMGVRGSATCALNYDKALGEIVGEENEGLARMFTMMNDTRLGVAVQAIGVAEIAYQNALAYAKERRQGRAPDGGVDARGDPIARHPDVQKMLLKIRCFVEGARALAVYTAFQLDVIERSGFEEQIELAKDRVALLTPAMKAHFTDEGFAAANLALQCFGGHGYITEWGIEQLVRDVRITQIYEGTNGVQALDLCTRKIKMKNGAAMAEFLADLDAVCLHLEARGHSRHQEILDRMSKTLGKVTSHILKYDRSKLCAVATDYLNLFSRCMLAWIWCDMISGSDMDSQEAAAALVDKEALAIYCLENTAPEVEMYAAKCVQAAELPAMYA